MRRIGYVMSAAVTVLMAAGGAVPAFAGDVAPPATTNAVKHQTMCPVTGDKIDKTIFADYEGKRVYFCCQDCVTKFNADPKSIVTKMEKDGIALDQAQAPTKIQKKVPIKGHNHSTMR